MSTLSDLIRGGFTKRQSVTLLAELAEIGSGGGGGEAAAFGGVRHARNSAVDLAGTTSKTIKPKTWTFDNPWGAVNEPAFTLAVAGDDPNSFGTDTAGWYLIRVRTIVRFSANAPDQVELGGGGYWSDNAAATFAVTDHGAGNGIPGVKIDHTTGPIWIPALGDDSDSSGYMGAMLTMHAGAEPTLNLFSGSVPMDFYVSLLAAS